MLTNSHTLLVGFLILINFLCTNGQQTKIRENKQLEQLKQIADKLLLDGKNFYNYSLICGGIDFESRVDRKKNFIDRTIPNQFKDFVFQTYTNREDECPKWANNADTTPKSGGMGSLSIPENTPIGTKIYLLSAIDPQSKPLYYFIRKAEQEQEKHPDEEPLFRVNMVKIGNSWMGEVILVREIDYETKNSYLYLTYAFDGINMIEKYSIVDVTDVDDEKPTIDTKNPNFNSDKNEFEFRVMENISIGDVVNPTSRIVISDKDTQITQLVSKLVYVDSGLVDSPFSINNNGEIILVSNLDYEQQREYNLKLIVQDVPGGRAEAFIRIELVDVADLAPKFIEPADMKFSSISKEANLPANSFDSGYIIFYENKLGPVFNISAKSSNQSPLGKIIYKIIPDSELSVTNTDLTLFDNFKLDTYENESDKWFLNCTKKIFLKPNGEEAYVSLTLRAIESSVSQLSNQHESNMPKELYTDKNIIIKIISGDMCAPKFDKDQYEFDVIENIAELIDPIYVRDCDHGVNGHIYLNTTNPDFVFKLDHVYRQSKLGIQMMKKYDYHADFKSKNNRSIEFDIIAKGSPDSLNKFESKSHVIIHIKSRNDFAPQFELPKPTLAFSDGLSTSHNQRIFTFKVPENLDYTFDVKAVDPDMGSDGRIVYQTKYVRSEDDFQIKTIVSDDNNLKVTIPGQYLDSTSKVPIIFIISAEDYGEPRLKSEIIINLIPHSTELKPVFFEFPQYEFDAKENANIHQQPPFALKLINDNLNTSRIILEELQDPLNLFEPAFESSSADTLKKSDLFTYARNANAFANDDNEIDNELYVLLVMSNPKRDFDQLYINNNRSDVYIYKLRARIADKPEYFNDVTVRIKLIDDNDCKPRITNFLDKVFNAKLNEDFKPNELLNLENDLFIPKITDDDFSADYGVRSLYVRLNDTRFYVDNERINMELLNNRTEVSLAIRIMASPDRISIIDEPVIWLNVTCEDNYFRRRVDRLFWTTSFLVRIEVQKSKLHKKDPVFQNELYVFTKDESSTGFVGNVDAYLDGLQLTYKIQSESQQIIDHFELTDNALYLKKPFDFEQGERAFNFSIIATCADKSIIFDSPAVGFGRTFVVVLINDINDNYPEPAQKEYTFYTSDDVIKQNTLLGTIYATDMDEADWNSLKFKLKPDELSKKFDLVPINVNGPTNLSTQSSKFKYGFLQGAQLITKEEVDWAKEDLVLNVDISDTENHIATTRIIIKYRSNYGQGISWFLLPEFESNPDFKFNQDTNIYSAKIKENSEPGTPLIRISARTNDNTLKVRFNYKLIGDSNPYYECDPYTGQIKTSGARIDRERVNLVEQSKQTILMVQAFYFKSEKEVIWSSIATVHIEIIDINEEAPTFAIPPNNSTVVRITNDLLVKNSLNTNRDTTLLPIYTLMAVDLDLNDTITYKIDEQLYINDNHITDFSEEDTKQVNFPFKLDIITGEIRLDLYKLGKEEFRFLIEKQQPKYLEIKNYLFTIRIKLTATDLVGHTGTCYLYVEFSKLKPFMADLFSLSRELKAIKHEVLPEYEKIKLEIMDGNLKEIDFKMFKTMSNLTFLNEDDHKKKSAFYSIDELLKVNTLFAKVKSAKFGLDETENLRVTSIMNPKLNESVGAVDAELYIGYDNVNGNLKLIRKLDYNTFSWLAFSLFDLSEQKSKLDVYLLIDDENDHAPKISLDNLEEQSGDNLVLVSVPHINKEYLKNLTASVSSTPSPPRVGQPDMPELGIEGGPDLQPNSANSKEIAENNISLNKFNDVKELKTYRILDMDSKNNFTVSFDKNGTAKWIVDNIDVNSNSTHIIFTKKNSDDHDLETISPKDLKNNQFTVDLDDGKHVSKFKGELYVVDIKTISHMMTHLPENGRYFTMLNRNDEGRTRLDLDPVIEIKNPFPYDIYLSLDGDSASSFDIMPKVIKPAGQAFLPVNVELYLIKPLGNETDFMTKLSLNVRLTTNNSYINGLLDSLGNLKIKVDLLNQNKYEPKIMTYTPSNLMINLDEGTYVNKEIAKIFATDRDQGDPGRIQYYLIGSNMLSINSTDGTVYLNGTLDAESETTMYFYCFARDLAPGPLGKNSETIKFQINIKDVNEFPPILQPSSSTITINETNGLLSKDSNRTRILDQFRYDCYDRDLNNSLKIILDSVRYVSKFNINNYMDDSDAEANNRINLNKLFRLIDGNQTVQSINLRTASLELVESYLDYESLFKPNETLIRIDVSCTDGQFKSESKLLVKIEDVNDNKPVFITDKNLVITKSESNLIETIFRVKAIDNDATDSYGNESLVYSIVGCHPDKYKIYMDKRTGEIKSDLVFDLDTEDIIDNRKSMFNNRTNSKDKYSFVDNYNRIMCNISVHDSNDPDSNKNTTLTDSMQLTIYIDNLNDNPPEIEVDKSNDPVFEIKEGETSRGLTIATIRVIDKDGASNLMCLFGNGLRTTDPFEVRTSQDKYDPHVAWCSIKVKDNMFVSYDAVHRNSYLLDLVVMDEVPPPVYPNKGRSSVQIKISVIAVNNDPPMFLNGNEEVFNVLDSIPPNTQIGTILATDLENPNPDRIIYDLDKSSITNFDLSDTFELKQTVSSSYKSSYWGSVGIFTKTKLNVAQSPYIFGIIAYDGPPNLKDTLSSRKIITVKVLNKGSMSVWRNITNGMPVDYYSVTIDEELPEDTVVVQVQASIPDDYNTKIKKDDNILISYLLDNNNPYYKIDNITGIVKTTDEKIDYEMLNTLDPEHVEFIRNIKVKVVSSDGLYDYKTYVSVTVTDINDNAPIFDNQILNNKLSVVENAENQYVGQVHATDADSGLNSRVEYSINKEQQNYDDLIKLFKIDAEKGTLYLVNKVDREINDTLSIVITASDSGNPKLSSQIKLDISVLDVNDNAPVFNATETKFRIQENTLDFEHKFSAYDIDAGSNGTVTFYIDPSSSNDILQKFKINPLNGYISQIGILDYETKNEYDLNIICADYGIPEQLSTTLSIKIEVIDVNDNKPLFDNERANNKRHFLNETSKPNDFVVKVQAIDADPTPEYHIVKYSISNVYVSNIRESFFRIDDQSKYQFIIDTDTGVIKLGEKQLDHTLINEYILELKAVDAQRPNEFFDFFNLTIVILPSNNKSPIFEQFGPNEKPEKSVKLFRRSLSESQPSEYIVDIIKAIDPNEYGIKYYLDSVEEQGPNKDQDLTDPKDLFSVGEEDGAIKTRKIRSSYTADSYKLGIRAVSKLRDSLSSTASVIIQVDPNIDSLFENKVYTISVDENSPSNLDLIQLKPKRNTVKELIYKLNSHYSVPQNVYDKWFRVNEINGKIQTNSNDIDYEKANEVLLSIDIFAVTNKARNLNTFIENLVVKIVVNDLNDNAPIFDLIYDYEPTINEDDKNTINEERMITKFSAFDNDKTDKNSNITYKIVKIITPNGLFSLNSFKLVEITDESNNGLVCLYKLAGVELDRDSKLIKKNQIKLVVRAMNLDNIVYTDKQITINLLDLNDNPPQITNDDIKDVDLFENQKIMDKFLQINAEDIDEGINAALAYQITSEVSILSVDGNKQNSRLFSIDAFGSIYLVGELDYERETSVDLTILIFDKSPHPLNTTKEIRVNVKNINDNYPKFDKPVPCMLSVYEGPQSQNSLIDVFHATDADNIPGSFTYQIDQISDCSIVKPTDKLFTIDSESGEFRAGNVLLDRETCDNYKVKISVGDQPLFGVQLTSTIECSVQILDINDNYPQFGANVRNNSQYKILPLLNEKSLIGWFGVSDLDLGENGTVVYSLSSLSDPADLNIFSIDSQGYLFISLINDRKMMYDIKDTFNLRISVNDLGKIKKLSNYLDIVIKIDPNFFKFDQHDTNNRLDLDVQPSDMVYLDENSPNDTFVAKVNVLNSFSSIIKNSVNRKIEVDYKLLTCTNIFKIDAKTGEISVLNSNYLDFEVVKDFSVSVEVTESQKSTTLDERRSGTVNILVKLNNLNDNPAVFNMETFEASFDENQSVVPFDINFVSLIQVKDADLTVAGLQAAKNQLDPLDIRLTGADSEFFRLKMITSNLYKLESLSKFDYEQRTEYNFNILAWDGAFSTSSKIKIRIDDVNDNKPIFNKKIYEFELEENSPNSQVVGTVSAIDSDGTLINNKTYYRIIDTRIKPGVLYNKNINYNDDESVFLSKAFSIDENTGEIRVNNSALIDREQYLEFNLTIKAYNSPRGADQSNDMFDLCSVIISLTDVNDLKPQFSKPVFDINIREKAKVPRIIAKVHAIDYDLNENGTVEYHMNTIGFSIDPVTGVVTLNKYLNIDDSRAPKSYVIEVFAQDRGSKIIQKSSCLLMINILDINDNPPEIISPKSETFKFDEDTDDLDQFNNTVNTILFNIKAIDPDISNSLIKYSLESDLNNDWNNFKVDEITGNVYKTKPFDFETKQEYTLKFICRDSGIMINEIQDNTTMILSSESYFANDKQSSYPLELTTKLVVIVQINDLDDNEPEFSNNDETFVSNVGDTLPIGAIVAVIPLAHDRDTYEENVMIKYYIISGNEDNKFVLNKTSGELSLRDQLEIKEKNEYNLLIRATSKGSFDEADRMIKKRSLDLFNPNLNDTEPIIFDKSTVKVQLKVVADKLNIEFNDQSYIATVDMPSKNKTIKASNRHKEFRINDSKSASSSSVELPFSSDSKRNTSIFYGRAHLKQRKLKRVVKFAIEMLQGVRSNEQSLFKLSSNLHQKISDDRQLESNNHMFIINENSGKVYVNREEMIKQNYNIGDKFVLTISAQSYWQNNTLIDENTLTHLTVRLTEIDYSFIIPMHNELDEILFEYLNPLHPMYIPRILEIDGIKFTIQDLVLANDSMKVSETNNYNLVLQDQKSVGLELFVDLWRNFSSSNQFMKNLNSFVSREPVTDARQVDLDGSFDYVRPFYMSWLFWLLAIIGVLLIIILIFFIFCIKLTKKQHKVHDKKPGIIIEYPPGVNPVYQDGVLNLNRSSSRVSRRSRVSITNNNRIAKVDLEDQGGKRYFYEDQELCMQIDDDEQSILNENNQVAV